MDHAAGTSKGKQRAPAACTVFLRPLSSCFSTPRSRSQKQPQRSGAVRSQPMYDQTTSECRTLHPQPTDRRAQREARPRLGQRETPHSRADGAWRDGLGCVLSGQRGWNSKGVGVLAALGLQALEASAQRGTSAGKTFT